MQNSQQLHGENCGMRNFGAIKMSAGREWTRKRRVTAKERKNKEKEEQKRERNGRKSLARVVEREHSGGLRKRSKNANEEKREIPLIPRGNNCLLHLRHVFEDAHIFCEKINIFVVVMNNYTAGKKLKILLSAQHTQLIAPKACKLAKKCELNRNID